MKREMPSARMRPRRRPRRAVMKSVSQPPQKHAGHADEDGQAGHPAGFHQRDLLFVEQVARKPGEQEDPGEVGQNLHEGCYPQTHALEQGADGERLSLRGFGRCEVFPLDEGDFRRVAAGMQTRVVAEVPPEYEGDEHAGDAVDQHHGPPARAVDLADRLQERLFQGAGDYAAEFPEESVVPRRVWTAGGPRWASRTWKSPPGLRPGLWAGPRPEMRPGMRPGLRDDIRPPLGSVLRKVQVRAIDDGIESLHQELFQLRISLIEDGMLEKFRVGKDRLDAFQVIGQDVGQVGIQGRQVTALAGGLPEPPGKNIP